MPAQDDVMQEFLQLVRQELPAASFHRLLLSSLSSPAADLKRVEVRRVHIKAGERFSFVYRHERRDETRNLEAAAALLEIERLLALSTQALLESGVSIRLETDGKGRRHLRRLKSPALPAAQTRTAAATHDRAKEHLIGSDRSFVQALGLGDGQGKILPSMTRKWKQINKFIEIFDQAAAPLQTAFHSLPRPLRIVDFGCGKAYLSFALQDHLAAQQQPVRITGVELREELISFCRQQAADLHLADIDFFAGDIRSFPPEPVDVVIALHACDIATDLALSFALRQGASLILSSPCCHKELLPQLQVPAVLQGHLQHPIHRVEEAELLTDSLRALLLQEAGYHTRVIEFISPEHTGKNKMILAVKASSPNPEAQAQARSQFQQLMAFFGIRHQHLHELLMTRT